jgi:hypothetical protein
VWQNSRNTQDRLEFKTLKNLVRYLCRVRKEKPGRGSFWNFTKIIKNKFRAIPALKMDELTLITESEKANAIASKFFLAHENLLHSEQSASVQDNCSALYSDVFSDDSASYTSPREIKDIIKKLKNGKAPGGDGVPNIFLKNI